MTNCPCSKEKEINEIHDSTKKVEQAVLGTGNNDGILHQTRLTNGRVSKLETWRSMIVGAALVVSGIGFTIGADWLSGQIKISVHSSMDEYLEGVEFHDAVTDVMDQYDYTLTQ